MKKIFDSIRALLKKENPVPAEEEFSEEEATLGEIYFGGLSNDKIMLPFKASALCDRIFYPDEKDAFLCCFSFTELAGGIRYAHYDSGGGDDLMVIQKGDSILVKGFYGESEVSPYARDDNSLWPGMFDGVPEEFMTLLKELSSEFYDRIQQTTFCFFRKDEQSLFMQGVQNGQELDDGADYLLRRYLFNAQEYAEYAQGYFSMSWNDSAVEKIQEIYASLGISAS